MFRRWPTHLGGMEVLPIQLPARENRMREPHFGTYEELASDVTEGIAEYLDRPYAVFGHCGGALPAFETVLRIGERGLRAPDRCFVSSQVAPQDGPYGRFLGLDDNGLRQELLKLLKALGSADPRPDLVELFLEVLEADLEANRRYRKEIAEGFPCPVTAIGWSDDVEVPYGRMTGWAEWAETDFPVLKGSHYTFLEAPEELRETLGM